MWILAFGFLSFCFSPPFGRQMLQRVGLQHWQKEQSGHVFFLSIMIFFSIFKYTLTRVGVGGQG